MIKKLYAYTILYFMVLFFSGFNSNFGATDPFTQNKKLGRGINILGYDPIWESPERARFKSQYFKLIKDAGFNSVRINLFPFKYMDDNTYKIKDSWLKVLDWAVNNSLKSGLNVIIDLHEYNSMADNPELNKNKFLAFWEEMSEHFSKSNEHVFFEILNEPSGKLTNDLWNQYLKDALNIIRKKNPYRTVLIGPGRWNSISSLSSLKLPDDKNIIVTIHYYLPMEFTYQGAPWLSDLKDKTGIKWVGSKSEKKSIMDNFNMAQKWSKANNRPIFLGEFGVYEKADMESKVRYLSFITQTAEELGWSWAYWQFDSDFVIYKIKENKWNEPILHAIIK